MAKENNLERFVKAQQTDFQTALSEIKNGQKRSHWMWYIFPQIKGLGFSSTSVFYSLENIREAEEFINHPILGDRLLLICNELLKLKGNDAYQIFGSPDDLKLKSSMTLFSSLPKADLVFQLVLDKFYTGTKDSKTLKIIGG